MQDKLRVLFSNVLGIPQDSITAHTSPDTVKGWDSLRHMNLIAAIEEEFDVELTDEEVVDCSSFGLASEILAIKVKR